MAEHKSEATTMADMPIVFAEEPNDEGFRQADKDKKPPWKVMVIDDDKEVLDLTRLILRDLRFNDQPVTLIEGASATEAQALLQQHPDTAVLLLDVVMESDDAGLKLVQHIRTELENRFVRIILRTGQPGYAPEIDVVKKFDINDYKEKIDLSPAKLTTAVTMALRSYSDLKTIEQLTLSNSDLEQRVNKRTIQLKESMECLSAIINNSNTLITLKDNDGKYLLANKAFLELTDKTEDEVLGMTDGQLFNAEVAALSEQHEREAKQCAAPIQFDQHLRHPEGQRYYLTVKFPLYDEQHRPDRVCSISTDITERRASEEKMLKLSSALEQTADLVIITDSNGIIEYVNPAFENITGYSKEEAIGLSPKFLKSGKQDAVFYTALWGKILMGKVFTDVFINRKKDGTIFYEEKTITPLIDNNKRITHFISTGKDITSRIETERHVRHLARHDTLTGLANRTLFSERLDHALAHARQSDFKLAVIFFDLDRFKIINDTLGYNVGDALLQILAQRLSNDLRDFDNIARFGGDEFAILISPTAGRPSLNKVADKILKTLAAPFEIQAHKLHITGSVGISIFPDDGTQAQTLLQKADIAMFRAKRLGRNKYAFYDKSYDESTAERFSLEEKLRTALANDEFQLAYQPQVDLKSGQIVCLEALLRWNPADGQQVGPAVFIPVLEESGLIIDVGEWVIEECCKQLARWQQLGIEVRRVAVNISALQFHSSSLVETIQSNLEKYRLRAECLEVEITEGLLIENVTDTRLLLQQLNQAGISISIDDFGTGYSSLNYLKRLPAHSLKIDQSFVRDITKDKEDATIVSTIINLGHNLGLTVIAEGVETLEQLHFLTSNGCDVVQGFLFCKPAPAETLVEILSEPERLYQNGDFPVQLSEKSVT